jgi:hypothetical protein
MEVEQLELVDEPAPAGADSGTLSLEEPGAAESQDTYSIRQTEPFRQYGTDEDKPGDKKEPSGKDDWGFLGKG